MKNHLATLGIVCLLITTIKAQQWDEVTTFNQVISALEVFDNKLFIGGGFTKREGNTCYRSAYYDGTSFTNHTTLIGGGGVSNFEIFNNELLSTGSMLLSNNTGVARWTGTTWASAGGFNVSHSGIHAEGNDLYVGGDIDGIVSKRTGTGNYQAFPGVGNTIYDIMVYNGNLVIGGAFTSYNSTALSKIAVWTGDWEQLAGGVSGDVRCLAIFNGELYAAGRFSNAGGNAIKGIAKLTNNNLWSDLDGSVTGTSSNGIRDMIVHDGKLFVVGDFDEIGGVACENVTAWNGSSWQCLNLVTPSNYANTVEVYNNKLYVGTHDFTESYLYSLDLTMVSNKDLDYRHQLTIAPNPANDVVHVQVDDFERSLTLELYDGLGNKLRQIQLTDSTTSIDCSELVTGVYYIKASDTSTGAYKIAKKFLIAR